MTIFPSGNKPYCANYWASCSTICRWQTSLTRPNMTESAVRVKPKYLRWSENTLTERRSQSLGIWNICVRCLPGFCLVSIWASVLYASSHPSHIHLHFTSDFRQKSCFGVQSNVAPFCEKLVLHFRTDKISDDKLTIKWSCKSKICVMSNLGFPYLSITRGNACMASYIT